MENFENILYTCFKYLDFSFNDFINNQPKRLIFQKYGLFLDEIFGLRIGRYSLYVHGPYNPSLASIGYKIANNLKNFQSNTITLKNDATTILNALKSTFEPTLNDTKIIETFSTFYYLLKKEHFDEQRAISQTIQIKGHLFKNIKEIEKDVFEIEHTLKQYNSKYYKII